MWVLLVLLVSGIAEASSCLVRQEVTPDFVEMETCERHVLRITAAQIKAHIDNKPDPKAEDKIAKAVLDVKADLAAGLDNAFDPDAMLMEFDIKGNLINVTHYGNTEDVPTPAVEVIP
jgi:hypothetical protein